MGLTIFRLIFYSLAGLAAFAAVVFVIRALVARATAMKKVYGVDKQNERQRMMLYAYYSVGLFILGLIFLGIGSLALLDGSDSALVESEATGTMPSAEETILTEDALPTATAQTADQQLATATVEPAVEEVTATATPESSISTDQPAAPSPPPTVESASPVPEATDAVEVTPTAQETATVNSPVVGLYLRAVPSGEILERLEDQAVVTLLNERQVVDDIEWVKVVAASGNEGWVAAEFLSLANP